MIKFHAYKHSQKPCYLNTSIDAAINKGDENKAIILTSEGWSKSVKYDNVTNLDSPSWTTFYPDVSTYETYYDFIENTIINAPESSYLFKYYYSQPQISGPKYDVSAVLHTAIAIPLTYAEDTLSSANHFYVSDEYFLNVKVDTYFDISSTYVLRGNGSDDFPYSAANTYLSGGSVYLYMYKIGNSPLNYSTGADNGNVPLYCSTGARGINKNRLSISSTPTPKSNFRLTAGKYIFIVGYYLYSNRCERTQGSSYPSNTYIFSPQIRISKTQS